MQTEGNKITLSFDEMGKGLTTYRQQLTGFEVAGEDKVFHPANARFGKDAQTVIVSSPEVEQPVAVRYAFKDYIKVLFIICPVFRHLHSGRIIGNICE